MTRIGECRCCLQAKQISAGLCVECVDRLGARAAALVARARRDSEFASRCMKSMSAEGAALFAVECGFELVKLWKHGAHPGLRKCGRERAPLHLVHSG